MVGEAVVIILVAVRLGVLVHPLFLLLLILLWVVPGRRWW